MTCERWREALSALADGEDAGIEPARVDAHVARCAGCRAYRDRVGDLQRRSDVRPAPEPPDLGARIARLDRIADRASRSAVVRGLLGAVGVEIVVLSLPALVLGDKAATSAHAARHLGAFTLAYGAALLVVVARPARARTVLPVAAVLAVALAVTALIDVLDGQTPLAGETLHVPEVISVVLVWLLAVPRPRRPADAHTGTRPRPALRLVERPPGDAEPDRRAL